MPKPRYLRLAFWWAGLTAIYVVSPLLLGWIMGPSPSGPAGVFGFLVALVGLFVPIGLGSAILMTTSGLALVRPVDPAILPRSFEGGSIIPPLAMVACFLAIAAGERIKDARLGPRGPVANIAFNLVYLFLLTWIVDMIVYGSPTSLNHLLKDRVGTP